MMKNFRTLDQAKKDRNVLNEYIELIERYNPETFEQHVIFEYALHGNIHKTAESINEKGISDNGEPIQGETVTQIITSSPPKHDKLHKQIRSLYLKKTRPARRHLSY